MTECTRWCYDCGCVVTVGVHDLEGRFIYASVQVSDEEIARAIANSWFGGMKGSAKSTRHWLKRASPGRIQQARENIALGKHIGTYRKWGLDE